ncbi:MAG: Mfa1 fimbrilin C-terminal domain-containing protein [Prevotellaceae bacterium]|nr:Mfa1 fimbrilin C-terminal domain-containing protein [Prevotellaceae bacterium]
MNKKIKLFSFALAALALGACSSEDAIVDSNDGKGFAEDGTGYVAVSINLPTRTASTRANNSNNDQFADGEASEYAVKDAILVLFSGASEDVATLKAAYDLNLNWNNDIDDGQISTYASKVQKISAITGDKKYALVILNNNGLFAVSGTNLTSKGTAVGEVTLADFTKNTADYVTSLSDFTGDGLFMTNAPLSQTPGTATSTSAVKILTDISDNIYPSEAAANAGKAADIIVERAVAKVQLTNAIETANLTVDGTEIGYSISGWSLANQNTGSYIVRNWDQVIPTGVSLSGDSWLALTSDWSDLASGVTTPTNKYRFAGTVAVADNNTTIEPDQEGYSYLYRTYFGMDKNYNTEQNFTDRDGVNCTTAVGSSLYCLENTFDVEHQTVKNTTCAIVKAKFDVGTGYNETIGSTTYTNFYVLNSSTDEIFTKTNADAAVASKADVLYSTQIEAGAKTAVVNALASTTYQNVEVNVASPVISYTYTNEEGQSVADNGYQAGLLTVSDVKYTVTYKVDNGEEQTLADGYSLSSIEGAVTALNSSISVTRYANSEAYYTVLIKHFGDDLTPWKQETKTTDAYPNEDNQAASNWLGRYGVLRNNWYDIEVTGVSKIGSATVPEINTDITTDDKLESYIKVNINVLSWAKRTQSTTLQ